MSTSVHSYLRTYRRKWALTQRELAFLLGRKSSSLVSKIEYGKRLPTADIMLACDLLFGVTPDRMFPKAYRDIESDVLARAAKLYEELNAETTSEAARKKRLLSSALDRAIIRINETEGA